MSVHDIWPIPQFAYTASTFFSPLNVLERVGGRERVTVTPNAQISELCWKTKSVILNKWKLSGGGMVNNFFQLRVITDCAHLSSLLLV